MKIEPEMLCMVVPPFVKEGCGSVVTTKYKTNAPLIGYNIHNDSRETAWYVYPAVKCERGLTISFVNERCLMPIGKKDEDRIIEESSTRKSGVPNDSIKP